MRRKKRGKRKKEEKKMERKGREEIPYEFI